MQSDRYNLGTYFNQFAPRMIMGVPPTKQFLDVYDMSPHENLLLLAFMPNFNAISDSITILEANRFQEHLGDPDLSQTLQYKLLTICGSFLRSNKTTNAEFSRIAIRLFL